MQKYMFNSLDGTSRDFILEKFYKLFDKEMYEHVVHSNDYVWKIGSKVYSRLRSLSEDAITSIADIEVKVLSPGYGSMFIILEKKENTEWSTNSGEKLVGHISTGYSYVDTEDDANAVNILSNLKKLEKFCIYNDIKWNVDINRLDHCIYLRFNYKSRFGAEYKLYPEEIKNIDKIESLIINKLINDFGKYGIELRDKGEKETMPTKRLNYDEVYLTRRTSFASKKPEIKDVIFSGPCTIVMWSDGDKTIVRCGEDDTFDKEKGLAMAISKKFLGTNKTKSNYCDIFKKFISEDELEPIIFPDTINTMEEAINKAFGINSVKHYTVKRYAAAIGKSESVVRKMCREGKLDAHKQDGTWIIDIK